MLGNVDFNEDIRAIILAVLPAVLIEDNALIARPVPGMLVFIKSTLMVEGAVEGPDNAGEIHCNRSKPRRVRAKASVGPFPPC